MKKNLKAILIDVTGRVVQNYTQFLALGKLSSGLSSCNNPFFITLMDSNYE